MTQNTTDPKHTVDKPWWSTLEGSFARQLAISYADEDPNGSFPWYKLNEHGRANDTARMQAALNRVLTASQSQDPRVEEIRERIADDYQMVPHPDGGLMLADAKELLAALARSQTHLYNAERELTDNKETIIDLSAQLSAMQAERDRMKEALRRASEISREYETEYDGRTYEYCTACKAALSEDRPHRADCAWTLIAAALTPTNDGGGK